jgi:hypothetical protein
MLVHILICLVACANYRFFSLIRLVGIGRKIVERLVEAGREAGCYKIIIDCSEDNVPFYQRCGFKRKECSLVLYLASVRRYCLRFIPLAADRFDGLVFVAANMSV